MRGERVTWDSVGLYRKTGTQGQRGRPMFKIMVIFAAICAIFAFSKPKWAADADISP